LSIPEDESKSISSTSASPIADVEILRRAELEESLKTDRSAYDCAGCLHGDLFLATVTSFLPTHLEETGSRVVVGLWGKVAGGSVVCELKSNIEHVSDVTVCILNINAIFTH